MRKQKPNPDYSSAIQHLLDLISLGEGECTVSQLLDKMRADTDLRTKADTLWDCHQYPDKAMKYVKTANYNTCRARFEISPNANMVLTLFENVMHQDGLIRISIPDINNFAFAIKIDNRTVKKAIKELLDNGFIAVFSPAVAKYAAVYKMNPCVAKAGKPISKTDIAEYQALINNNWTGSFEDHPLVKFKELQERKDNVSMITQKYQSVGGETIKYNSLQIIANKEKESAASDTTDSDQELDDLFNNH